MHETARRRRYAVGIAIVALNFCLPAPSLGAETYTIETVAGAGGGENNGDGAARQSNINQPFGVEVGPDGALYITEVGHHRVRRLDRKTGQLTTVAGSGTKGHSGDGGPATDAAMNEPYEVRFDLDGNMYVVEMRNHIVRRMDAKTKTITTIAGTGEAGYGGDGGPASKAQLRVPHSIALSKDAAGDSGFLFIADIGNHRIRHVNLKTGVIETMAGDGTKILPVAGNAAKGNPVVGPRALFVEGDTLWVALREGHSVWKIDLSKGLWHHVAGTGEKGYSGDGGPARQATFNGPKGIAVGPRGHVYVVDTENQAIRKIDTQHGTVTTIAGYGPKGRGFGGDGGDARRAKVDRPHGICVDAEGNVYIGDTNNHRVRVLRPLGGRSSR